MNVCTAKIYSDSTFRPKWNYTETEASLSQNIYNDMIMEIIGNQWVPRIKAEIKNKYTVNIE